MSRGLGRTAIAVAAALAGGHAALAQPQDSGRSAQNAVSNQSSTSQLDGSAGPGPLQRDESPLGVEARVPDAAANATAPPQAQGERVTDQAETTVGVAEQNAPQPDDPGDPAAAGELDSPFGRR